MNEDKVKLLEILVVNCNKAVSEFMASTKKHDKVESASRVREYQNLFNELANETLGVEIINDSFNFYLNEVGLNETSFYTAISYLSGVERKEREKANAKAYEKWYKENYEGVK